MLTDKPSHLHSVSCLKEYGGDREVAQLVKALATKFEDLSPILMMEGETQLFPASCQLSSDL